MTRAGTLVALALLLLVPARLTAQGDRWAREVRLRLERGGETVRAQGYRDAGPLASGLLFVGESRQLDLSLGENAEYLLLGGCDADCTGLELVVSNATGYQTDAARGPGTTPVVRIDPGAARGPHRLTITLSGCRVSPCRYGVELFIRRAAR